jgi:hypothetical protein
MTATGVRRVKAALSSGCKPHPAGMAAFGSSLKVGEFLLPSGLMAISPDGHVAGSEVSPAFPGLAHAGYSQAALSG